MTEGTRHRASDGAEFRIDLIQTLDLDPLFYGVTCVFNIERQGSGAATSGTQAGTDPSGDFEVQVLFAPIFISIATFKQRAGLDDIAQALVCTALDQGTRSSTSIRVGSDGTAKLGDTTLEQILPLRNLA